MSTLSVRHEHTTLPTARPQALHIGLWATQALLAVAFAMAGSMKLSTPIADLATQMAWVGDVPAALVRLIGAAELAGAVGLILPAATRIRPGLTALAGAALVTVMVLAAAFHLSRGEGAMVLPNLVLGSLAAFVAWGRARKAPIVARVAVADRL